MVYGLDMDKYNIWLSESLILYALIDLVLKTPKVYDINLVESCI